MAKQANKTMIGAFVAVAAVLVICGILVFGAGTFLTERQRFVMYFEGSVKGLDTGASVDFRGVNIGSVTDILVLANPHDQTLDIAVYVEIDMKKLENIGNESTKHNPVKIMQLLVKRGLRGRLEMQSLVTGKLIVELDFNPDKPANFWGLDTRYPEIPTIQSDLAELAARIESVPIEGILEKLHSAVAGLEKVINSPDFIGSVHSLNQTLEAVKKLVNNIDNRIEPLSTGMDGTIKDARKLLSNTDKQVSMLVSKLMQTSEAATAAGEQAEKTFKTVGEAAGSDSGLVYELNTALKELSSAAHSVRVLADYLSRHPESLLRGKGDPD